MVGITNSILQKSSYEESSDVSFEEEMRLRSLIRCSFPSVTIDRIEKINNKYLYAAFMLKKSENQNYFIKELIHSTAAINVPSIKNTNLNWRLVNRAKYGFGVSFSGDADYANYHGSYLGGDHKAFIICDVLMKGIELVSDTSRQVPTENHDTFRSINGHVYVKFEDFTFYPKYALYYIKPPLTASRFHRIKRKRW